MALRRARHVQRSANVKEFAVMVEVMDFLFVGKQTARFVVQDGILFPGVPKSFHHVQIFIGDAITQRMFRVLLALLMNVVDNPVNALLKGNFIGIDLNPDYVTIASARIAHSFKKTTEAA